MKRIIGTYSGKDKGPLLICFGGMHGNEPAGVRALQKFFTMLEKEPHTNPAFTFNGRMIGLIGNLRAYQQGERFLTKDLNRQWTKENVKRIRHCSVQELDSEDLEMLEILDIIDREIDAYEPEQIIVLDLHTTTAYGGIFSIPTDAPESIRLAMELHAPVIKGFLRGIAGTSLHYFSNSNFRPDTIAVCFESGQHQEELSVKRAIAAITNCLRTLGCVQAEHVENRHDNLLIEYSSGLPKLSQLVMKHTIEDGDHFLMAPNFKNFQVVRKGDILAFDDSGPIRAPIDGRILMPLYQKQGDDGFFLIRDVEAS